MSAQCAVDVVEMKRTSHSKQGRSPHQGELTPIENADRSKGFLHAACGLGRNDSVEACISGKHIGYVR